MNIAERDVMKRAEAIASAGGLEQAVRRGAMEPYGDVSLSEALVLGLLAQGVRKYIGVFGHGSTDLGHMLMCYEEAGLVKMYNLRNETVASHCAATLKWQYGENAAVVTSIGPGALHAFAGSLVAASNGIGIYYLFGDDTTHDEGPNMQSIPVPKQHGFLELVNTMGMGYVLHTPEAVFTALRKGAATVFHPYSPRPFYFLLPRNTQPRVMHGCNLLEIPTAVDFPEVAVEDERVFAEACELAESADAVTIKIGGGAADCGAELLELADLVDAVIVSGAKMSGVVPYSARRHMGVGGSKGSLCGNYAMENADLVVAVGARAVCQWDCSGTAWKSARHIINFNTEPYDSAHYNRTLCVLGNARQNLRCWIRMLKERGFRRPSENSDWLAKNMAKKEDWEAFKKARYDSPLLFDRVWDREVLSQPAAIKTIHEFAKARDAVCYFDAGDVQANGFQVVEDQKPGRTFTDTGSSYMGFAASALMASAVADEPVYGFALSGDGSFTMNPQILFDGVEHGARGCLVIFDNRRMGAITGLQCAQYGEGYKTSDSVEIDYVALAQSVKNVKGIFGGYSLEDLTKALEQAYAYPGLSVIHLPVYFGENELGGLGVFGSWNVGNWCDRVQREHHRIGL